MPPTDVRVISGKHVLRPPPGPISLDDAADGDVANLKGAHFARPPSVVSTPIAPRSTSIFHSGLCGTSRTSHMSIFMMPTGNGAKGYEQQNELPRDPIVFAGDGRKA